jgi:hypothetical protein
MRARRLRPAAGVSAGVALLCAAASPARADRIDVAGEARLGTSISAASQGLLGAADGPCGDQTSVDGSFDVSGTVVGAFYGRSHRYQLAGSIGYYTPVCTTFLRRPVGGLDLRGEHALSERTRLSVTGRLVFDRFDRSNDARAGNPMGMDMAAAQPQPQATTDLTAGQAAGTGFVQGSASIEAQHALSKRYGLRAGFALRLFDAFASIDNLPEFSTLGPMYAGEFLVAGSRELPRDKLELPLRYRVSHFYPATLQKQAPPTPDPPPDPLPPKGPPGVLLSSEQVPPAHDLYLAGAWEHRFDPRFTLRVEAGPALMVQPHLCTVIDPAVIKSGCSIDKRASGVRAFEAPPPLELPLGSLAGLTVAGEASLSYTRPRTRVEVKLTRGYEPDPYAGALALIDRLALDYLQRPFWELTIYGNLQLLHSAHTSLGRVSQPPANEAMMMMDRLQLVSPQNRTLYMALGNFSVDWQLRSFVSVFVETSFQVLAIRGEPLDPMVRGGTEVQRFPQPVLDPMNPTGPPPQEPSWQETQRLTVLLGARLFFGTFPSLRREAELFTQARSTP